MKSKTLLAVILAILSIALLAPAAEPAKAETKSWWTDFSVSPFGAVTHPGFNGPVYGTGIDVGYAINRTVSLHVASLAYETDNWKGPAIDESSLLFRADLIRYSKERFVAYALGGADRDWDRDDWAFGVGIGAEVRLAKNLSLGLDSRIRAWFKNEKDVQTRGFFSLRF
jgi:hypothetical protein